LFLLIHHTPHSGSGKAANRSADCSPDQGALGIPANHLTEYGPGRSPTGGAIGPASLGLGHGSGTTSDAHHSCHTQNNYSFHSVLLLIIKVHRFGAKMSLRQECSLVTAVKKFFFILAPAWIQSADTSSRAVSRKTIHQAFHRYFKTKLFLATQ
jgi:hypothetical protein